MCIHDRARVCVLINERLSSGVAKTSVDRKTKSLADGRKKNVNNEGDSNRKNGGWG